MMYFARRSKCGKYTYCYEVLLGCPFPIMISHKLWNKLLIEDWQHQCHIELHNRAVS